IRSGAATAVVSEEALPNGIPDSLPLIFGKTASGTITASDVDIGDVLTMGLGLPPPTLQLTSGGGGPIVWALTDNHTLVGRASTTPIITVTITDAGAWTVTLAGPVDQDPLTFSVPVNVSDGHATTPTSLSITIEDDSPVAISPQPASLADHAGATVTVPLDSDGQIDNDVVADQPVTFA